MPRTIVFAGILLCLGVLFVPSAAVAQADANDSGIANATEKRATIVGVYPNPVPYDDAGEFVTIAFPPDTNGSRYALRDSHATVTLQRTTSVATAAIDERVVRTYSTHPNVTRELVDEPVSRVSDRMQLANDGEEIRLLRNGTVIDRARYETAKESAIYDPASTDWQSLGATNRPVITGGQSTVEAFVLPDNPERAIEFLERAEERILLAGYTLSSPDAVDALIDAQQRNLTVEVLIDNAPVGGMSRTQVNALEELAEENVRIRLLGGKRARYRYHHAKYAIVDDRALVTTENWKPAGIGGTSSRGWGVITPQESVVEGLVETYRADSGWVDTIPWTDAEPEIVDANQSRGEYPPAFESQSLPVEQTELLVTPENAGDRILKLLDDAKETIDIKQVRIGDRGFPFLQKVLAAADRGVRVRILLSSAWYVEEENRELQAWLQEQAAADDLPLEVRLADPSGNFEKIHAKGVIVDGEYTLVGSINWNNNSINQNREVALLLESEAVGSYFGDVFVADWEAAGEPARTVPIGLLAAVGVGALGALAGARRIQFGGG
jgi:cardiolipin synthase